MWAALAPVTLIGVAFVVYCVVDITRHEVRWLPKWAWIAICCLSIPLGVRARRTKWCRKDDVPVGARPDRRDER